MAFLSYRGEEFGSSVFRVLPIREWVGNLPVFQVESPTSSTHMTEELEGRGTYVYPTGRAECHTPEHCHQEVLIISKKPSTAEEPRSSARARMLDLSQELQSAHSRGLKVTADEIDVKPEEKFCSTYVTGKSEDKENLCLALKGGGCDVSDNKMIITSQRSTTTEEPGLPDQVPNLSAEELPSPKPGCSKATDRQNKKNMKKAFHGWYNHDFTTTRKKLKVLKAAMEYYYEEESGSESDCLTMEEEEDGGLYGVLDEVPKCTVKSNTSKCKSPKKSKSFLSILNDYNGSKKRRGNSICHIPVKSKELRVLLRRLLSCPKCGDPFVEKEDLKRHMATEHPEKKTLVRDHSKKERRECLLCGQTFKHRKSLHKHLLKHSNNKTLECKICGKVFKSTKPFHRHLLMHSKQKTLKSTCNVNVSSQIVQDYRDAPTPKPYFRCDICSKQYRVKMLFEQHMLAHEDGKSFTCKTCERMYESRSQLRRHTAVHSVE